MCGTARRAELQFGHPAVIRSCDHGEDPGADPDADPDHGPCWHHGRTDPGIRGHRALVGEKANAWYAKQPWLVGSNYIPATAINELEMWQADTFDAADHRQGARLGRGLGMNTMRVFLHDLPWQQDPPGFRARIDRFLDIAAKHHIRPLFVLFDSCWDPQPTLGPQHAPKPGVHNSGWVQAPGAKALSGSGAAPAAEGATSRASSAPSRRTSACSAGTCGTSPTTPTAAATRRTSRRTRRPRAGAAAAGVRSGRARPAAEQPLTSGVWKGDWSSDDKLSPIEQIQLEQSDVISFHNYDSAPEFEKRIVWLQRYNRPIICTEYMARGNGSTFEGSCRSRRSTTSARSTGASSPARRRRTCPGTPGRSRT